VNPFCLLLPVWVLCTGAVDAQLPLHVRGLLDRISSDTLRRHIEALGSDVMEGRGTGTPGGERAARYIEEQLRAYGLRPASRDGSYRQEMPLHGSYALPESRLEISTTHSATELQLWSDYLLFNSGAQTFIPLPLPLVFVGYGIVAPEYDYNDYRDLSVENAVVVFLSGEPPSDDEAYFQGPRPTIYSNPALKQQTAIARGARGSIMIPSVREQLFTDWEYWTSQYRTEDVRFLYGVPENLSIVVNPMRAKVLFEGAPSTLEQVQRLDALGAMRSFRLEVRMRFDGRFRERDFLAANIAGVLPGGDPLLRDTYVVVSAHYDHLGIGVPVDGDSIYNGVFDNAAGTAGVLELARVFSSHDVRPSCSVLFLFVTGEEKGRLGSRFYCENPLVPLYRTRAALNVDGLALFEPFREIVGVGAELSTLGEHLETVAGWMGVSVGSIPPEFLQQEPFSSSDQFSFAQAGIPSVLVSEGLQYVVTPYEEGVRRFVQWGRTVYHTPSDDLHQPMDFAAAEQHVQILGAYLWELGTTYVPPQWLPGSPFTAARLQSIAEKR
jgi:hypothetical protein